MGHPLVVTYCTFSVALQVVPRVFQAEFVNLFLFFSVSSLWSVEWAVFSKKEVTTKLSGKNIFFANQYKCMLLKMLPFQGWTSGLPSVEALLSQLVGFSCHDFHWDNFGFLGRGQNCFIFKAFFSDFFASFSSRLSKLWFLLAESIELTIVLHKGVGTE